MYPMYFDVHCDKCDHLSQAREGDGMMTIIMIISMISDHYGLHHDHQHDHRHDHHNHHDPREVEPVQV